MKTGRERRRHRRYLLRGSISYRILRLPPPARMVELIDRLRPGRARDISRGGVCFMTRHILLPGTVISMDLPPSPIGKRTRRRTRVIWTREARNGEFRVGVKFL